MGSINLPKKFTSSAIVDSLANSRDISRKDAKEIVGSLFEIIEQGVLQGQRVPLGNFGKVYMHNKPARDEREGINPRTKEKIVIKAKPATKVPKFSFSKSFKEKVQQG